MLHTRCELVTVFQTCALPIYFSGGGRKPGACFLEGSIDTMDNRTNTIAGWVLAGCGAALGLSILSGMMFHSERPEKMGYPIEGVDAEGGDGGDAVAPIATRLVSANASSAERRDGHECVSKCGSRWSTYYQKK